MALVELMCPVQMLPLEEAVLAVKGSRADEVADAIVHRIAKHSCEPQEQKEPANRQIPPGAEGSCGKQQRIARQKWCNDNTGFQKDDHKEDEVHPYPILLDDSIEIHIEMQENINEVRHPWSLQCK